MAVTRVRAGRGKAYQKSKNIMVLLSAKGDYLEGPSDGIVAVYRGSSVAYSSSLRRSGYRSHTKKQTLTQTWSDSINATSLRECIAAALLESKV